MEDPLGVFSRFNQESPNTTGPKLIVFTHMFTLIHDGELVSVVKFLLHKLSGSITRSPCSAF